MKTYYLFFIIITLLASCSPSNKLLEKGNYEAALKKAAKKIKKNPSKFEEVDIFNEAYRIANNNDHDVLTQLKQQGNPANWKEIYSLLVKMNERQKLAISLPSVGIVFEEQDYRKEIEEAKLNASEYAYTKGIQLLKLNDRFSARKAYEQFIAAKKFDPSFKDVEDKIIQAKSMGISNTLFTVNNDSKSAVPVNLLKEVNSINVNELNRKWVNYDNILDTNTSYHYLIVLNLELINISPERINEKLSTQTKEVEDGFNYELDENGNVKKDSLGNDIKTVKYKTINCSIKEFHQQKSANISGTINYIDNITNKVLKSEPIVSEAFFENYYSTAQGDLAALQPKTRETLNSKQLPFPDNIMLLMQAGEALKKTAKEIMLKNKNYLK